MRIPIRKSGKYTNLEADPNLTETKFAELQDKLKRLKKKQPRAIGETARLAAHGDFSENAGYQAAKAHLRSINQGIIKLTERIKHAVIIKPNKNAQTVQLGQLVTVETNNKTKTYQILGSAETNPSTGVISNHSPLGSALMGRRVGEIVTVKLAQKIAQYKIIKIE